MNNICFPVHLIWEKSFMYEANQDENSVIHFTKSFYEQTMNKNYCYLSKTKSVSTSNTFCRVQLSWCVSIDPKENL